GRGLPRIGGNPNVDPEPLRALLEADVVQRIRNVEREDVFVGKSVAVPAQAWNQRIGIPAFPQRVILRRAIAQFYVPLFVEIDILFGYAGAPRPRELLQVDADVR